MPPASIPLALLAAGLAVAAVPQEPGEPGEPGAAPESPVSRPTVDDVRSAGRVIGLAFTDSELELMLSEVADHLRAFERLRSGPLPNSVAPALGFTPLLPGIEASPWQPEPAPLALPEPAWPGGERPAAPRDLEDLAFADIPTLAALIRAREVSCVELAELSLARLKRLDPKLHFVVTLTEERALERARALDAELDEGRWRGPLHGIPWGAKDLLAVRGYRTTFGAKPFEDQILDLDAAVVRRLDEAGAVLVAKLTLGALAWGDVWFGGRTRNPWNPRQGSSGSSAGSASAVAAGCVVFSIGSETLGSIVSPSDRCGASSLRPTFGRVSRDGAMALAWSMDKLGPICRSLEDAALVLAAIAGPSPEGPEAERDAAVVDLPYRAPFASGGARAPDVAGWRVGYLPGPFEKSEDHAGFLDELRALGVELVPLELPDYPVGSMTFVLSAEAACAFDELTRDGRDDQLVRQVRQAWPNVFRAARLVPAVEYLRANRLRAELCRAMDRALADVVAYVHPSFEGTSLTLTNLTGHPAAVAPCGFTERGTPVSVTFTGKLYDEARLLALAAAWQRSTAYHERHPDL